jgi:hypothetical protein
MKGEEEKEEFFVAQNSPDFFEILFTLFCLPVELSSRLSFLALKRATIN